MKEVIHAFIAAAAIVAGYQLHSIAIAADALIDMAQQGFFRSESRYFGPTVAGGNYTISGEGPAFVITSPPQGATVQDTSLQWAPGGKIGCTAQWCKLDDEVHYP